jgi:cobyrinic acid a,c-diamide synthase
LPGGYPELHLQALHDNVAMLEDIQKHYKSGKVILAECGGMLYLLESLKNHAGLQLSLAGLLLGTGKINKQLSALGAQEVDLPEGILRGHTFHYSVLDTKLAPLCFGRYHTEANPTEQRRGEAVYRSKRLTASYIHFYFPSNPLAIVALFKGSV